MDLLKPQDSLERQNAKLRQITDALMRRVEQGSERANQAYAQFERAALLEDQVRQRTRDLEHTLDLLNTSNAALADARQEAEAATANMANAIEAVQDGFAIFGADERLIMCNSRFGMLMPDIRSDIRPGMTFPEYAELVSRSVHLVFENGMDGPQWARERLALHRQQHAMFNLRLLRDRWLQVSDHRMPDGGTVILQTDVTDVIRLERVERGKLLDTQARMVRATLDHLNQGICIFDKDATLVDWNQRAGMLLSLPVRLLRVGMRFDRLMSHLITDLETPAEQARAFAAWAHQKEARGAVQFEVRRRPDMALDVFAQEMPDRGFVISFTDVSAERKATRALSEANELLERRVRERTLKLEDALSEAERANASKTRFVAAASHDLLQPLSAAKLYMSSLVDGVSPGSAPAQKAINALGSAESIIDALLNISKLDAGAAHLDVTSVSLGETLAVLRDEFEPMARLKGLDLRILPSSAYVTSDPGFLQRILQNLIGNAIKYTKTGRVLVGARRVGNSVRVDVLDTGPGIAIDDQDRIFREFERLPSKDAEDTGLGLGLAIVERACAQLGHPLSMRSGLGEGSVFSVLLKRAGQEDQLPGALGRGATHKTPSLAAARLAVLIVEDDMAQRSALTALLERWGVQVVEASDAEVALALLEEIALIPDAAILDYQLGDGPSGLELAQSLRRLNPDLPLCVLSAYRSDDPKSNAMDMGLLHLTKPLDPADLKAFLHSVARAT